MSAPAHDTTGPSAVPVARPLLVVTHPGAITADSYDRLAARLGGAVDTQVHEIERLPDYRQALMSGRHLDLSLTELAAQIAVRVADRARGVPFDVLGWSFGGVVACALADVLPDDAKPRRIIVLDTIAPRQGESFGDAIPDREALDWFAMYFGAKRRRDLRLRPSDFTGVSLDDGLATVLDRSIQVGALRPDTSVHGLRKVFQAFVDGMRRNKQLQDGYFPGRYTVPITVVRPERGLFDDMDTLGWDAVATTEQEILHCGGDHYTMLEDEGAVDLIARRVERDLLTG